jgi:hypothetical protein
MNGPCGVAAPPSSTTGGLTPDCRRTLGAIERLPEAEREVFDLAHHGLKRVATR